MVDNTMDPLAEFSDELSSTVGSLGAAAVGEGAQSAPDTLSSLGGPMDMPDEQSFNDIWSGRTTQVSSSETVSGGPGDSSMGGVGSNGIVDFAKKFVGTPYVWGGESPTGFDCSGFTRYVMREFGIELPRISYQQGQGGQAVSNSDMKPGDLVFWDNSTRNNGADHVGIYIGDGMFISAPQAGESVKISQLYGNYWARRYTSGTPSSSFVGAQA